MPMESKAQWRMMFAKRPKMAKEMADKTKGGFHALPEKVRMNAIRDRARSKRR